MAAEGHEDSLGDRFPDGATCQNCVVDEDAIAFCQQCTRLLCDECLTHHGRQVDTRGHDIIESPRADELKKLYHCTTHTDKTLDFFCMTCNTAICQHCQVTACRGHEVMVSTNVKDDMNTLLDKVKEKKEEFTHHAEFIEATTAQNEDALIRCEGEIRQAFDDLVTQLEESKNNIISHLKEETGKNNSKVEQQKEFVRNTIDEMNRTIAYTENLLSTKKDSKLMVNKVKLSCDLEGRALHDWNKLRATYRCWQLNHKDQQDYASKFSHLIPKPRREDIKVNGLSETRVGVNNVFTITTDIADQLEGFDLAATKNFLSVKIIFTPTDRDTGTVIQRTIRREGNVWTVSYFLRQHGEVAVYVSICGIEVENQPFVLRTDSSRKEIKVGDLVIRGPDWKWENQDGGTGSKGTVVEIRKNGWVNVKWSRNVKHDYRWGAQDSYDLEVVPPPPE